MTDLLSSVMYWLLRCSIALIDTPHVMRRSWYAMMRKKCVTKASGIYTSVSVLGLLL